MTAIPLPHQRPVPGPASAVAAPAGEPGWSRVLVVAGSRAALVSLLSLLVWSVLPVALGWTPRVIMSGSMEPHIHVGDVIVGRPVTDPATLAPGQVLTVTDPDHPGKTRTHRLVERDGDGRLVLKGDANPRADSTPVDPQDVLGLGVIRVPYVGTPMAWVSQGQLAPLGIVVTVLLLLGLGATAPLRMGERTPEGPDDGGPDGGRPGDGDTGLAILTPASASDSDSASAAPGPDVRPASRLRRPALSRWALTGLAGLLLVGLATPGTYAALGSTTSRTATFFSDTSFGPSVYADAVMADAPVLFWRFEESAGTNASDYSGNGRDAVVSNPTWAAAGALLNSTASRGLGLSGTEVRQSVTSAVNGVYSLELWVRTTSTAGGPLVTMSVDGIQERALYLGTDGKVRFGRGAAVTVTSPGSVNDGSWHHVVLTAVDSGAAQSRARLYVDGAQVATGRNNANTLVNGSWRAGYEAWSGTWDGSPAQYLSGTIDEVAIDDQALAPARVTAHYKASGR